MTSKVYEFLNDSGGNNFTESAPRPPVPGEENELQSNGGMSTQSSGSHKSHVSNKSNRSQSSNKSAKSSKSVASNKGEVSHSPAATPRKSNLEKVSCSLTCSSQKLDNEEMDAPLGFEPEGSAANSPPFTETSTPPHLRWAENLNHLLSDSDGVQLFKDYLEKDGGGTPEVNFWFACQGLKRKEAQNPDIPSIVKAIYKHFIRNDGVKCLDKDIKQEITDKINRKAVMDQCIYDAAEAQVERYMRNVTYPAFLNSDFYVQYVQSYGDSPKSSHSSGSNSARPVSQSGPLPSLPEDKVLETGSSKQSSMGPPLLYKVPGHKYRSESTGAKRTETISGPSAKPQFPLYSNSRNHSYPNHVSYAPASAQDSELQSLSSDALTDDTMSLTDSSIDIPHYNWKRQRKAMKSLAQQNRESSSVLQQQFIPRTERAPKDRNIAETDPQRFAQMLIEKLQAVLEEREAGAKMEEKLRCLSEAEDEKLSSSFMKNTTATSIIPMMSTSAVLVEDENAESILDQHCSRIWANSNHHTPSRSPGRHSPRNKSPDRQRKNQTLPISSSSGHRSRKSRGEFVSSVSVSCDSGVGDDKFNKETHRHIHHHHHHHHPSREVRTQKQIELEAQQYAHCVGSRSMEYHSHREMSENNRGRTSKKSCATRKGSDASSHIDSGISMVFDKDSLLRMPLVTGPTSEKVMQWMMDSERVQDTSAAGQDSEKASSHKGKHRLNVSTGSVPPTHKQSSKKTVHGTSRSASMERSSLMTWSAHGQSAQILPNQPFAQDSSMPLPPPPNPMTQLEEARRRLETQSRTAATSGAIKRPEDPSRSLSAGPVKSKSFAGVPSREKSKQPVTQSASQMRTMPSARTVPSDLDMSGGSQTFERPKTVKKTPTASANTSMNTSTSAASANETIVGIYIGQEPIPYRHVFPGRCMTLAQFKTLITKKGNFKYFFKRDSDEFGGEGAVFEEVRDDNAVLPTWQEKIVAKVEKID